MSGRPQYTEQSRRLEALGVSLRTAAADLRISRSSLQRYLKTGETTKLMEASKFPAQVARYIKLKDAEQKNKKTVQSVPLSGRFGALQMPLAEAANMTGLARDVLMRGIYRGIWPDESTRDHVASWIDQRLNAQEEKRMITKVSLPDDVLEYWSLKRDPFTNEMESVEDIVETSDLKKAEKKILNAVDKNGWVAITGPVGSGKSTLVKKVEARLEKRKDVVIVKPRIIEKQFLGASHVCDSILRDLGTSAMLHNRTLEHKARLVGETLEEAYRDNRKVSVIIDEAHLLRPEALLALKRIHEFEVGFKKLLSIVLIGQDPLARTLKSNLYLKEVGQRVDLFELGGMNGSVSEYVRRKLELAGGKPECFEKDAFKAMLARNVDTPLSINNLAAAALIEACYIGEKSIKGDIVKSIPGTF